MLKLNCSYFDLSNDKVSRDKYDFTEINIKIGILFAVKAIKNKQDE